MNSLIHPPSHYSTKLADYAIRAAIGLDTITSGKFENVYMLLDFITNVKEQIKYTDEKYFDSTKTSFHSFVEANVKGKMINSPDKLDLELHLMLHEMENADKLKPERITELIKFLCEFSRLDIRPHKNQHPNPYIKY